MIPLYMSMREALAPHTPSEAPPAEEAPPLSPPLTPPPQMMETRDGLRTTSAQNREDHHNPQPTSIHSPLPGLRTHRVVTPPGQRYWARPTPDQSTPRCRGRRYATDLPPEPGGGGRGGGGQWKSRPSLPKRSSAVMHLRPVHHQGTMSHTQISGNSVSVVEA